MEVALKMNEHNKYNCFFKFFITVCNREQMNLRYALLSVYLMPLKREERKVVGKSECRITTTSQTS